MSAARRAHALPAGVSVFTAGAATFALELLGPRRLAPRVGTSIASMTAAIAVVLAGSAAGAAFVGRRSARTRGARAEGVALLVAAVGVALGTALARAAVSALPAAASTTMRALVGSLVQLALPSAALCAVAVLASRRVVGERPHETGVLGRLAAIGTLGGVTGLAVVSAVLLAHVPVSASLHGVCAMLALLGALCIATAPARPPAGDGAPPPPPPRDAQATSTDPTACAPGLARLALASAATGFAVLCLEVTAVRRVCARVGSSLEAWTAVLLLVLVATAVGAARARDRGTGARGDGRTALALGAGVLAALLDRVSVPAALSLPGLSPWTAVFVGATPAYGPAFALLGAVGPRLSRAAAASDARSARGLALVSAAGTLGALLATLVTAPWLLPAVRTEGAIAIAALVALAGAAALADGPAARGRIAWVGTPAAVLLALSIARVPWLRASPPGSAGEYAGRCLVDEDGAYARVTVVQTGADDDRIRRLSIDARIHGTIAIDRPSPPPSAYMALAAEVLDRATKDRRAPRVLVLGGGGFAIPHEFLGRHPTGRCDVIELDDTVVAAARALLLLREDPRLRVITGDARAVLATQAPSATAPYDAIFVDAFGDVSVPWTLTTAEFVREAKARLAPGGTLAFNAIDAFVPGRLVAGLHRTLRDAFSRVEVVVPARDDERLSNFVLLASDAALDAAPFEIRTRTNAAELVVSSARYARSELLELERRTDARVLTDDFAPVEALVAPTVARTLGR